MSASCRIIYNRVLGVRSSSPLTATVSKPFLPRCLQPCRCDSDAFPPQSIVFRPSPRGDKALRLHRASNVVTAKRPGIAGSARQFVDLPIVVVSVTAGWELRATRGKTPGTIWPATQSKRALQLHRLGANVVTRNAG